MDNEIREKGTRRNTEWRRKGDKMDERDVEEERKDRKKVHFWNFIFMFVIRNLKTRRANKASCISCTVSRHGFLANIL
jgi:hypothetical protein